MSGQRDHGLISSIGTESTDYFWVFVNKLHPKSCWRRITLKPKRKTVDNVHGLIIAYNVWFGKQHLGLPGKINRSCVFIQSVCMHPLFKSL